MISHGACQGCTWEQLGFGTFFRTILILLMRLSASERLSADLGSDVAVRRWQCPDDTSDHTNDQRVVSFSDWHGDYNHAFKGLLSLGLVDNQGQWSGGSTIMVHTGDVVDRGDDDIDLVLLLWRLQHEAQNSNGQVLLVLGNHELLNLQGDTRYVSVYSKLKYVTRPEYLDGRDSTHWLQFEAKAQELDQFLSHRKILHASYKFGLFDHSPKHLFAYYHEQIRKLNGPETNRELTNFASSYQQYLWYLGSVFQPLHQHVWSANGSLGRKIRSSWRALHRVQDVLFVHGNIVPEHLQLEGQPTNDPIGLADAISKDIETKEAEALNYLGLDNSMLWNRDLSEKSLVVGKHREKACKALSEMLQQASATLLVKGHDITTSGKPEQQCYNNEQSRFQVILADTMMSYGYTRNVAESERRFSALEWYGSSSHMRATYPLQEPRACYDLQPKGCTAEKLLDGTSFGSCQALKVNTLVRTPQQSEWQMVAFGNRQRIYPSVVHTFNPQLSSCPAPGKDQQVELCRGGDCISQKREPLRVSCVYDHTACSLSHLRGCPYIAGRLHGKDWPTVDGPGTLFESRSFLGLSEHLPRVEEGAWLSHSACPSRLGHAEPAVLRDIKGDKNIEVWCERQCRPEMILEYSIGFQGRCAMLEVMIDDRSVKFGKLTRDNINEWSALFHKKRGQQSTFVSQLDACTTTAGDGFREAAFHSQANSELKLKCYADPCGLVSGAVSRTSKGQADGDCKCKKWLHEVKCGTDGLGVRKFFIADLLDNSACVNSKRRCVRRSMSMSMSMSSPEFAEALRKAQHLGPV